MTLTSIFVHMDADEGAKARLDVAKSLAQRAGASLTGVFGQRSYAEQVGTIVTWPSREYVEAVEAARALFTRATADMPATGWHDVNRGSTSEVVKEITRYARYGDLTVIGQPSDAGGEAVPPQLAEEVTEHSGRPVLIVPHGGVFKEVGRRPLIVWNDSREAARVLHGSLALLEGCTEATLLSLAVSVDEARQSCREVERYLACHGIAAKSECHGENREGVWELVLDRIASTGADLLVVGAHRQIGFPFVSFDVVLQEAPVPVLTAS